MLDKILGGQSRDDVVLDIHTYLRQTAADLKDNKVPIKKVRPRRPSEGEVFMTIRLTGAGCWHTVHHHERADKGTGGLSGRSLAAARQGGSAPEGHRTSLFPWSGEDGWVQKWMGAEGSEWSADCR